MSKTPEETAIKSSQRITHWFGGLFNPQLGCFENQHLLTTKEAMSIDKCPHCDGLGTVSWPEIQKPEKEAWEPIKMIANLRAENERLKAEIEKLKARERLPKS